jgi:hypothetical protein
MAAIPLQDDAPDSAAFLSRYRTDKNYFNWFVSRHGDELHYGQGQQVGNVPENIIKAAWQSPGNRRSCSGQRLGPPINSRHNIKKKRPGAECCSLTSTGMFGTRADARPNANGEDCGYAFDGPPVVTNDLTELNRPRPMTSVEKGLRNQIAAETIKGIALISGAEFADKTIPDQIDYLYVVLGNFEALASRCGAIKAYLTKVLNGTPEVPTSPGVDYSAAVPGNPNLARLYVQQLYMRVRLGLRTVAKTKKLAEFLDKLCASVTKEPRVATDLTETGGYTRRRTRRRHGRRRTQKKKA